MKTFKKNLIIISSTISHIHKYFIMRVSNIPLYIYIHVCNGEKLLVGVLFLEYYILIVSHLSRKLLTISFLMKDHCWMSSWQWIYDNCLSELFTRFPLHYSEIHIKNNVATVFDLMYQCYAHVDGLYNSMRSYLLSVWRFAI